MMTTMLSMPNQIQLYEQIGDLSMRMVEAARIQDWDTLIELEQAVASLRDTLKTIEEGNSEPGDIERKRLLIQQILQDDAEIRRHTEPWMEQVRQFLGASNRRQQVVRAYGAV